MCTHLAAKGEAAAVNVQLIGIASNLLVLSQLMIAQVMPVPAFAFMVVIAVLCSVMGALKSRGMISDKAWLPMELLISIIGMLSVPQVCSLFLRNSCCAYSSIRTPAYVTQNLCRAYFYRI